MKLIYPVAILLAAGLPMTASAAEDLAGEVAELKQQVAELKTDYEARITDLEQRLALGERHLDAVELEGQGPGAGRGGCGVGHRVSSSASPPSCIRLARASIATGCRPVHHGLQLKGGIFQAGAAPWHEVTIVVRAWIVAAACALDLVQLHCVPTEVLRAGAVFERYPDDDAPVDGKMLYEICLPVTPA